MRFDDWISFRSPHFLTFLDPMLMIIPGATIGILTGLTSPFRLAGAVSLSGFVPLHDKLDDVRFSFDLKLYLETEKMKLKMIH